jgi:hypothetical protein
MLALWRVTALVSTKFGQAPHFPANPLLDLSIGQLTNHAAFFACGFDTFPNGLAASFPGFDLLLRDNLDQTGPFQRCSAEGAYLSLMRRRYTRAIRFLMQYRLGFRVSPTSNKVSGTEIPRNSRLMGFPSWEGPVGVYDILLIHD